MRPHLEGVDAIHQETFNASGKRIADTSSACRHCRAVSARATRAQRRSTTSGRPSSFMLRIAATLAIQCPPKPARSSSRSRRRKRYFHAAPRGQAPYRSIRPRSPRCPGARRIHFSSSGWESSDASSRPALRKGRRSRAPCVGSLPTPASVSSSSSICFGADHAAPQGMRKWQEVQS